MKLAIDIQWVLCLAETDIPTHPKPASGMADNPMGDSVRIAEKYWCIE